MDRQQLEQAALQLGISRATMDLLRDDQLGPLVADLTARGVSSPQAFAERWRRITRTIPRQPQKMAPARRAQILSYTPEGREILRRAAR